MEGGKGYTGKPQSERKFKGITTHERTERVKSPKQGMEKKQTAEGRELKNQRQKVA